jgi:hypothetical protein
MITYEGTVPPVIFIIGQVILTNPVVFPVCILGIYFLLFKTEGKPYRIFCWIFLIPFAIFLLMRSRIDRVAPAYPVLIASGSMMTELLINKINKDWLKSVVISLLMIGGIFSFIIFLPVFPPSTLYEYSKKVVVRNNKSAYPIVPMGAFFLYYQFFTDRLGWESMVEDVATVYNRLPEKDKEKAVIFASNYGEAGAIELFGSKYNLPMVISLHNNYRLWGYGNATGDLVISIGVGKEMLNTVFETVEESGVIHKCDDCMDDENNLPVYICRKTKIPLKELWKIENRDIILPSINTGA